MTSQRIRYYKGRNLTFEEALIELKKGKGVQFDPKIVDVFEEVIREENIEYREKD
jgi:HD-GYP domain-containing protein (c-di-GMP phosphodiesterase class II)